MVAGDLVALFVNRQAAVRVAVEGKADIQLVVHYELLQMLDVGAAAVRVDVVSVRMVIHHVNLGAQGFEYCRGNLPGGAVGNVQAYLYVFEAVLGQGNEVADVTVAARHVIHGTADGFPFGNRYFYFTVNIIFHL